MGERFTVVVERGEDGYFLSEVIELPGCRSQAKTVDDLMLRTREAIALYRSVEPAHRSRFVEVRHIEV
jgi:predicted RNase H-like HicB family nuclease